MPNLANILKDEIRRLAKKEVKIAIQPLRKQLSELRRTIAELKREKTVLQKRVAQLPKAKVKLEVPAAEQDRRRRFSPKMVKALRARKQLSLAEMAKVLGVNMNTVWNWETGRTRPNQEMLNKLAAARRLGKRQIKKLLSGD